VQGIRQADIYLRAPAHPEPVQGVRWPSLLRAPARMASVQGVRRVSLLRAPAHSEPVQGLRQEETLIGTSFSAITGTNCNEMRSM